MVFQSTKREKSLKNYKVIEIGNKRKKEREGLLQKTKTIVSKVGGRRDELVGIFHELERKEANDEVAQVAIARK